MRKFEYFLVGVFAAIGALLLEIIFDSVFSQFGILESSLIALASFVVIEELAKFIVIRRKIELQSSATLVLGRCFWIGLGFGLSELGIILLNERAVYVGNTLAIMAVILVHVLTTLLTGLTLVRLRTTSYYGLLAILPALILHLTFNYWVLQRLN